MRVYISGRYQQLPKAYPLTVTYKRAMGPISGSLQKAMTNDLEERKWKIIWCLRKKDLFEKL